MASTLTLLCRRLACRRLTSLRTLNRSLCQVTQMMESPFPMPDDKNENFSDYPIENLLDYQIGLPGWVVQSMGYGPPNTLNVRLSIDDDPFMLSESHEYFDDFMRYDRKPGLAKLFLSKMLVRGAIPNLSIFLLALKCYCCKHKHLSYQHILDLYFIQMKALGIEANGSFYETMVNRVGARFGPYVGFHLLKKLRSSQRIQMPLSCYNVVVRQLCRWKMIKDASMPLVLADVFMDMEQQWVFPDEKSCSRLLQLRNCGGDDLLKAVGIGRLMFAKGLRVGAYAKLE